MKNTLMLGMALTLIAVQVEAGETTIGVAAVKGKSPYKGFDNDVEAALLVEYKGDHFAIDDYGLEYHFSQIDSQPLDTFVFLNTGGAGYEISDSDVFKGMEERDASLDLGVGVRYTHEMGVVTASLQHDISGAYKGMLADLNYKKPMQLGSFTFEPAVGLSYLSEDFVDYYFGVTHKEATASRKAYQGDTGFATWAGYEVTMPIGADWQLEHTTHIVWLSDEIKDSPLVDRSSAWATTLGVSYKF